MGSSSGGRLHRLPLASPCRRPARDPGHRSAPRRRRGHRPPRGHPRRPGHFRGSHPHRRGAPRRRSNRERPPGLLRARRPADQHRHLHRRRARAGPLPRGLRTERRAPGPARSRGLLPGRSPRAVRALRRRRARGDDAGASRPRARRGEPARLRRRGARRDALGRRQGLGARGGPLRIPGAHPAAVHVGHVAVVLGLPVARDLEGRRPRPHRCLRVRQLRPAHAAGRACVRADVHAAGARGPVPPRGPEVGPIAGSAVGDARRGDTGARHRRQRRGDRAG